ncbi:hypothetical protein HAX54_052204, partial [Datura stramonium]|nr:hypothetical protein [Datura stramonium]
MVEVVPYRADLFESGIQELQSDLLDLTQKAIKKENTPPLPTNAEEEAIEWGLEEEILKETFKTILLNSGGLEE